MCPGHSDGGELSGLSSQRANLCRISGVEPIARSDPGKRPLASRPTRLVAPRLPISMFLPIDDFAVTEIFSTFHAF